MTMFQHATTFMMADTTRVSETTPENLFEDIFHSVPATERDRPQVAVTRDEMRALFPDLLGMASKSVAHQPGQEPTLIERLTERARVGRLAAIMRDPAEIEARPTPLRIC